MCTDRDPPPCEHVDLIAEVDRLQGHNASLTATVREFAQATRRRPEVRQASGGAVLQGWANQQAQTPRPKAWAWGTSATASRRLQMRSPSRQWMCRWPTTTVPDGGGVLEQEGVDVVYVTDIPAMPRPQVTEYRVQVCRCRGCGRRVRGRHAEVGADQYGASAHRMGRRVMAAAHVLHYGVGIPVRRVPVCAEGADRSGAEPGCDHPGRTAPSPGRCGRCVPEAAGFGVCESRSSTQTTLDGEWAVRAPS